jgi:DUF971 family protein
MNPRPTDLRLSPSGDLLISWSDGEQRAYKVSELRAQCPCASCREKRTQPPPPSGTLPVLSLAEAQPLTIRQMNPAGAYAYKIGFSDGHDTGIYTLELLRRLGGRVES